MLYLPVYHFCVLHSASTRKVYEKKLQKLLDQPPAEPDAPTNVTALPKTESNQNGNTNSDQYSDKEDGENLLTFLLNLPREMQLFTICNCGSTIRIIETNY